MKGEPSADLIWSNLKNALIIVDDKHQIVDANPAAEDLFGTSVKRLLGKPILREATFDDRRLNEVLQDKHANLTARNAVVNIKGGGKHVDFGINVLASEPQWRLISIAPLSYDDETRTRFREQGNPLAKTPDVLGHEIKNPLAAIRGSAQLLARSIDDELKTHTRMITAEVDRIVKLLDRMQSLSTSQLPNLETVNIHSLIDRARRIISAATDDRIEIADQFDPSLPNAKVDPDYMMQILTNLLANAIDAVKNQKAPEIKIQSRFSFGASFATQNTEQTVRLPIEIVVTDNGPGVPSELEDDIFSPFVTTKSEGQGLGLALVRKLVTDMNGRIKYDRSSNGETTEFTVYLPMADEG